jgi:hypothetical protein
MFVDNKGRERNKTLNAIRDYLFPTHTHTHTHTHIYIYIYEYLFTKPLFTMIERNVDSYAILFHCYNQNHDQSFKKLILAG